MLFVVVIGGAGFVVVFYSEVTVSLGPSADVLNRLLHMMITIQDGLNRLLHIMITIQDRLNRLLHNSIMTQDVLFEV